MTEIVIVSGTRWARDGHRAEIEGYLEDLVDSFDLDDEDIELAHGDGPGEPGVDKLVDSIATEFGWKVRPFPARWSECGDGCPPGPHRKESRAGGTFCPKAGPRRSRNMVDACKATAAGMLALPEMGSGGQSGTWAAVHYAADQGLTVVVRALKVQRPKSYREQRGTE